MIPSDTLKANQQERSFQVISKLISLCPKTTNVCGIFNNRIFPPRTYESAQNTSSGRSFLGLDPFKRASETSCIMSKVNFFLMDLEKQVQDQGCFSITMKRHHQGNLSKKAFNWGLDHSFRGLIHDHHGGKYGSRITIMDMLS